MTEQATTEKMSLLNVRQIMDLLPHRYPFLLVDRVTEIVHGKYINAYKCVSINEPFFQGHFPSLPVMPGVLIVESLAQAGGLLVLASNEELASGNSIFLFTGIESVRFRKQVVPGDKLELHCELIRQKMKLWKMRGTAHVDGVLAAEAELTAAVMPKEDF